MSTNSTRARSSARVRARIKSRAWAKRKSSSKKPKWLWRIAAVIFVVWAWGSFVPDPEQDPRRTAVLPTTEPATHLSAQSALFTPTPKPTPLPVAKRFSENERRDIFRMVVEAENRAYKEANSRIPTYADSTTPMDDATIRATTNANMQLTDKLTARYKSEVYKRFQLSKQERELIDKEGLLNHWPPL